LIISKKTPIKYFIPFSLSIQHIHRKDLLLKALFITKKKKKGQGKLEDYERHDDETNNKIVIRTIMLKY